MMGKKFRISITGPESSGKTALALAIGEFFPDAEVIREYAREFLEARLPETDYSKSDLLHIGQQQRSLIESCTAEMVVCDTDYLVLHIWMSEVFGDHQSIFHSWFKNEDFDLVLLCAPDIDWHPDPLRENETDRWRLFELYERALKDAAKNYTVVRGIDEDREQPILSLVQDLFEKSASR